MRGSDSLIIPTQIIEGYYVSGAAYYTAGRNIKVKYTTSTIDAGLINVVSATWNY